MSEPAQGERAKPGAHRVEPAGWGVEGGEPEKTDFGQHRLWPTPKGCGEVEDVVGALTPVVGGVAQVFHDLCGALAEVEEGEKEDRQEEGEEVKGGSQVEETTTTWMAMMMTVSGVRARLELEPLEPM